MAQAVDFHIRDILTREEIRNLSKTKDILGWLDLLTTWGMIGGCFVLLAWKSNFMTVPIALIILGGRHLALAILTHDAVHNAMFQSRRLNQIVGTWLCAYPALLDFQRYRTHHLRHHAYTGEPQDPDISLVARFPVTRQAMFRKVLRDLSGVAALKRFIGIVLMATGYIEYTVAADVRKVDQTGRGWRDIVKDAIIYLHGPIIFHAVFFYVLYVSGHPHLYLWWWVSWATTFSLFIRLRSIAEHACTGVADDPLMATRTTSASIVARLTVAPHHVNYHLEHHLLMNVPSYHFRTMHRLLTERGVYQRACYSQSYIELWRYAIKNG